jgi:hypothetical protein
MREKRTGSAIRLVWRHFVECSMCSLFCFGSNGPKLVTIWATHRMKVCHYTARALGEVEAAQVGPRIYSVVEVMTSAVTLLYIIGNTYH